MWHEKNCIREYCKTTGTYAAIDPQPNLRALSLPPGHPNLARRQRRNTQHRRPPPPAPPARRISSLSPSIRSSVPFLLHHGLSLIIVARCRRGANTRRCWLISWSWWLVRAAVMEPTNQMRKVLNKKLWDQPHQKREGKWWRKISVCNQRHDRFCLEAGWAGDKKYVWFGNNRGHKGRMVGVTISITIG